MNKLYSLITGVMLCFTTMIPADVKAQYVSALDTIVNTKQDPYSCVCYQLITRKQFLKGEANFMSTGFLIRPNIVLTAGHNVYSNGFSNVTNICIFPGRYKNLTAYDTIEISGRQACEKAVRVHPSYRFSKKNRINYDFAIIIIPQSAIATKSNWPSTACFEIDKNYLLKKGDTMHVAGFPASHGYDGSLMTCQEQTCDHTAPMTFNHNFDTQTGNSGSPIWVEKDGRKICVGVHTFGGAATKLTKEDIDLIQSWIAAYHE